MSDDQFMKLFREFAKMQKQLDYMSGNMATKDDIRTLQDQLDGIAARLDHNDTEHTALESQVDRHDNWIKQLATTTDTKLAA